MANIIYYHEQGAQGDVIQVEDNLTDEGNFHIVVREEISGTGSDNFVYAGILFPRSEALKLIQALALALASAEDTKTV